MNRDEIHKAVTDFLALLKSGSEYSGTREENLKLALDRLALAYHFSDCKFDEGNYPDAPKEDHDTLHKVVSYFSPDYGNYNTPSEISMNIGEAEIYVGDAIDDITDIALDMIEILWLWENTSVDNALWQFRWGYENHWGEHLRCLQLYLLENSRGV